jgi:hypothetical protein
MFTPRLLALPVAAVLVAVSAPASIAATPAVSSSNAAAPIPETTAQGFIMSDGRICNPRWGC